MTSFTIRKTLNHVVLNSLFALAILGCSADESKYERFLMDSYMIKGEPLQVIEWNYTTKPQIGNVIEFSPDSLISENREFRFNANRKLVTIINFNNKFEVTSTVSINRAGDSLSIIEMKEGSNYFIQFKSKNNVVKQIKTDERGEVIEIKEMIYNSNMDTLLSILTYQGRDVIRRVETFKYEKEISLRGLKSIEHDFIKGDTVVKNWNFDKYQSCEHVYIFKKGKPHLLTWRANYYREADTIKMTYNKIGATPFLP